MMEALDCAAIRHTLQPIRTHLEDLLTPFKQVEAIDAELRALVPPEALDFLVLAWHHDHFVHQARAQTKGYHQRERDFWLACAAGLLGDAFDPLHSLVVDKLDSIIRASSLVEMVNALIRPYLNSCKGQITQETLNLIMFYHNHRRYKSGKRQGKAPIELLTGKPLDAPWWELLRRQLTRQPGLAVPQTVPARTRLHLGSDSHDGIDQQTLAADQTRLDFSSTVAEHEHQDKNAQAA
jgi:hypothetical protein